MSVLDVEFVIPDTVEELFALIGDPAEEPTRPFIVVLRVGDRELGRAPIGIYRLPAAAETLESEWPARFDGPLEQFTDWELLTWKLAHVNGGNVRGTSTYFGSCSYGSLTQGDQLEVSVRLVGLAPRRKRWWHA